MFRLGHGRWRDHWLLYSLSAPWLLLESSAWSFHRRRHRGAAWNVAASHQWRCWIGVYWSNPWKRSSASLSDSSGNWWKDEISTFPLVVLDSRKYFFRNFSTISSHARKLSPLNEWSHLFASPAKEKDNRLRWMASSRTPAIFTVLQISMYVVRSVYRSSLGRPWNRFPGSTGWGNADSWCWPLTRRVWLCWWSTKV